MLSVIMLIAFNPFTPSVIMLSVVKANVVRLNVVAPDE